MRRNEVGSKQRAFRDEIQEICAQKNYQPLRELLDLIPFLSKEKQASVHIEMISYFYAKPTNRDEEREIETPTNPLREKSAEELIQSLPLRHNGQSKTDGGSN